MALGRLQWRATVARPIGMGTCRGDGDGPSLCARPAPAYQADVGTLPRARPTACYCDSHGGPSRAIAELAHAWAVCAPASVGGESAVIDAGCMGLRSTEAYVVVRPEHGIWLAWLGLGSYLTPVLNPRGGHLDREGRPATRRGPRGARVAKGSKSFPAKTAALEAARAAWARQVDARVGEIERARGGTLAWGRPVMPLAEPIIIELGEHGSAWDVAESLPRRAPMGDAWIRGVRSSGECA